MGGVEIRGEGHATVMARKQTKPNVSQDFSLVNRVGTLICNYRPR